MTSKLAFGLNGHAHASRSSLSEAGTPMAKGRAKRPVELDDPQQELLRPEESAMNVELIRSSFATAVKNCPELTARFYEILLAEHPELQHLFHRSPPHVQQRMLAQALAAAVEHVEDGPWLERTLKPLGARHVGYGVTAEMYDWVGAALLRALGEAVGSEWSDEHVEAWSTVYGAIVQLMRAGEVEAVQSAAGPASAAE